MVAAALGLAAHRVVVAIPLDPPTCATNPLTAMPKKPRPTRLKDLRKVRVPNEMHSVAGGALLAQSPVLAAAAVDLEIADVSKGSPLKGRYSRIRTALMKKFGCSSAHAERAIALGKAIRMEQWLADLPSKRAELSIWLERIATAHEDDEPSAAIAAIREIARLNGLYAPKQFKVTHGVDLPLQLDAILEVLDERGHAALAVVMEQIEAAKAAGRLALPAPAAAAPAPDGDDEVSDAELVDDPRQGGAN